MRRADGRAVVAGWYGAGNAGDELLLHTLLTRMSAHGVDDVLVLGGDPRRVAAQHGVPAQIIAPPGKVLKLRATLGLLQTFRERRLLVLGPGTILQERSPVLRWPGTLPLFLRLAIIARLAGARVVVLGSGVREDGTFVGRVALRLLAGLCSHVFVRDASSAALMGPRAGVIGDLAFAWEPPSGVGVRVLDGSDAGLGLSLRPLPGGTERGLARTLLDVADRIGSPAAFYSFSTGHRANREDDREVHAAWFQGSAEHRVVAGPSVDDTTWIDDLTSIAGRRAVVATRLHAAVVALKLGVPTVALAYERKVSVTFEMLGLGDQVLPVTASSADVCHALAIAGARVGDGGDRFASWAQTIDRAIRAACRDEVDR